jgi:hypothetical protein
MLRIESQAVVLAQIADAEVGNTKSFCVVEDFVELPDVFHVTIAQLQAIGSVFTHSEASLLHARE